MTPFALLCVLLALSTTAYYFGRRKAFSVGGHGTGHRRFHSQPAYHGALAALGCAIPALLVFAVWIAFESRIITLFVIAELPEALRYQPAGRLGLTINEIRNIAGDPLWSANADPALRAAADHYTRLRSISHAALSVVTISLAIGVYLFVRTRIAPGLRARNLVEKILTGILIACSTVAVFTTVGIVMSVLYESLRFFRAVPITEFLFGLNWSPQLAIRADQIGSTGAFGAVPIFLGTALISAVAMAVAVPVGLMAAIYLSEYAAKRFRVVAKPLIEILAGIPTVVYGFFAALTVAPFIRSVGEALGLDVASESALAAGLVMGIMIIPFVSSLSDDFLHAVPQSLRDGSYSLGATRSETIRKVVVPAALPGIIGGILLAISRAIGETMIVVMAAGLAANLTVNPLKAVTTVTVQIVTLLVGDQEFDSPKTLAAFALGLVLFVVTLCLNVIALYVVRKYREQYE
jgi:phosphate transport system permease protein